MQLLIRPAVNFVNGHRYVVGMRTLRDRTGTVLEPTAAFKQFRDKGPLSTLDPRTERYERDVFPVLEDAGFARGELYQAWDFSVASATNTAGRLLNMRDDAFAQLGDTTMADRVVQGRAPAFTVATQTVDLEGVRTISGSFEVPCYIDTPNCLPGGEFRYDPVRDPGQTRPLQLPGNVTTAAFTCKVPRRVYDAPTLERVRPSLYGHGLLGSQGEVGQGQVKDMIREHGFMYCATDWEGFATGDIPTVAQALVDMDRFPAVIDHTQQGELNFLYLARLMIHPDGFPAQPAFQVDKGSGPQTFLDTTRAYYDGNSQGGIYGGTVMAVAPDVDRGVLGVPGTNYSTLLSRSVDFELYSLPLYTTYPSEYERPLLFSVIQLLWDRADPNGYVNTLAPGQELPDTPPHEVMYQVAFGDHQVANVTADVAARSAGAAVDPNALQPGRSPDVTPVWGAKRIPAYPYRGSAIVYFDTGPFSPENPRGTPAPPTTNTPPFEGQDPHEAARRSACGRVMKTNFLRPDGVVTAPCLGAPYGAFDWLGPDGQPGQGDTVQPGDALPYPTPVAPQQPQPPTTPVPPQQPAPSEPAPGPAPSSPVPSAAPAGLVGGVHVLTPSRLLDTRQTGGPVRAGADRDVAVLGRAGVPTTGVRAVLVNATVTGVTRRADLQLHPAGQRPAVRTSNLNAVAGQTVAVLATVPVGTDGRITLSLSQGSSHVVLDVLGWVDDGSTARGDGYLAVAPERRLDTRRTAPLRAGTDRTVELLPPGVRGSAAVVNVTALRSSGNADLQLHAAGDAPARRTSTLNLRRGQTVANLAVVPVDDRGRVVLSASQGAVDVVLDLVGVLSPESARGLTLQVPTRGYDTRIERAPLRAGEDREVRVLGMAGVPASGVEAVLLSVTSTRSTAPADLQVTPAGQAPAVRTSSLNVRTGQDVAAQVWVRVGRDGRLLLSTSQGRMDVVLDVLGWVRTSP